MSEHKSTSKCAEDNCNNNSLYNYKNSPGYRYCVTHIKTRLINGQIQRMSNKSKESCTAGLCPKTLSKESKTLCVFHLKLKTENLKALISINNIKDLNKLKQKYKLRDDKLNEINTIIDVGQTITSHITKYMLQGLKNIDYEEELEEFKNTKHLDFEYVTSINIADLDLLKKQWNIDYMVVTNKLISSTAKETKEVKDNNPKCIVDDCTISANYNVKGSPAIYCSKHANDITINQNGVGNLPNQIRNVRTKLCEYKFKDGLDCIKIALYGFNKKQFCLSHLEEGMYKLSKDKKCKEDGCTITPSYGMENSISEYCKSHATENMIQLYQKCIIDNCNKRARYNNINTKGSKYCSVHKTDDMKDNTKKICIEDDCTEEAVYNVKYNNQGIYCSSHKKENMCSNKNKICKHGDCLTEAYFGTRDDQRQYCLEHADTTIHFNYHNQPQEYWKDIENNKLNKEKKVKKFLKKNNIKFEYNKKIKNSPDGYRPDFLLSYPNHYIIIEVDENQHKRKDYTDINEQKRYQSIITNLKKPVLFIRINTDYYWTNNNREYTKLKNKLNVLLTIIAQYENYINETKCIYLYYDCNCVEPCNHIH